MRLSFSIIRSDGKASKLYSVEGEPIVVGRAEQSDVILDNDYVSGTHAQIQSTGTAFFIQDLKSTNGTYLDGQTIDGLTRLQESAVLEFGRGGPKLRVMALKIGGTPEPITESTTALSAIGDTYGLESDVTPSSAPQRSSVRESTTGMLRAKWPLIVATVICIFVPAIMLFREKSQVRDEDAIAKKKAVQIEEADRRMQQERDQKSREEHAWTYADLVLVNGNSGVAVQRILEPRTNPGFKLLTRTTTDMNSRLRQAWDQKIPVIDDYPALTRRLISTVADGARLDDTIANDLTAFYSFKSLPHENSELVSFVAGNKTRIGFRLASRDSNFDFCELIPARNRRTRIANSNEFPFVTETISLSSSDVSRFRVLSETELKGNAELNDPIHYLLFVMLSAIQSRNEIAADFQQIRPSIYVDGVTIDAEVFSESVALLRKAAEAIDDDRLRQEFQILRNDGPEFYAEGVSALLLTFQYIFEDVAQSRKKDNLLVEIRAVAERRRSEIEEHIAGLRLLEEAARTLRSEIQGCLSRNGTDTVARPAETTEYFCKVDEGKHWRRPGSETAVSRNLVQATHVLLSSISPADGENVKVVAQLVDIYTGLILASESVTVPIGFLAASSRNRREIQHGLTGTWHPSEDHNVSYQITEEGDNIVVSLKSPVHYDAKSFHLVAERRLTGLVVTGCSITHKEDPKSRPIPTKMRIAVLANDRIEISGYAVYPPQSQGGEYSVDYSKEPKAFILER